MLRVLKLVETDSRMVAAGGGKNGSYCFVRIEFQFGMMENFWGWRAVTVIWQCERT